MTHVDGNVTVNLITLYANLKNLIKKKRLNERELGLVWKIKKLNKKEK